MIEPAGSFSWHWSSAPLVTLDVRSPAGTTANFWGNNANNFISISDNNGTNAAGFGSIAGGNWYLYTTGYGAFYTGGTERMRINSSGIVLIGTTSASGTNKLQVSSDALINGIGVGIGGGVNTVNTAVGLNALANNSATGYYNTAIGCSSLINNVLGQNSTSTGFASLQANTTSVATFGAITGGSGYTDGSYTNIQLTYSSGSTAITYPLVNITVAGGVVTVCTLVVAASGTSGGAGFKDITTVMSCANTVIGGGAGGGFAISPVTLVSGGGNCGFGAQALNVNTTGSNNCAMGVYALVGNTVGSGNTAIGNQVMFTNQTGSITLLLVEMHCVKMYQEHPTLFWCICFIQRNRLNKYGDRLSSRQFNNNWLKQRSHRRLHRRCCSYLCNGV